MFEQIGDKTKEKKTISNEKSEKENKENITHESGKIVVFVNDKSNVKLMYQYHIRLDRVFFQL